MGCLWCEPVELVVDLRKQHVIAVELVLRNLFGRALQLPIDRECRNALERDAVIKRLPGAIDKVQYRLQECRLPGRGTEAVDRGRMPTAAAALR